MLVGITHFKHKYVKYTEQCIHNVKQYKMARMHRVYLVWPSIYDWEAKDMPTKPRTDWCDPAKYLTDTGTIRTQKMRINKVSGNKLLWTVFAMMQHEWRACVCEPVDVQCTVRMQIYWYACHHIPLLVLVYLNGFNRIDWTSSLSLSRC